MKKKIIRSIVIAYLISSLLSPPDALSLLINGTESALVCCILLFILSRRKFVKSSSNSVHILVCVLVCVISILIVQWAPLFRFERGITKYIHWSLNLSSVRSSKSFQVGNLWINHLSHSGGILSKDTEWVICSLDPPKTSSYDGSTKVLTFSDSNSVEIKSKNGETVWIDKQHEVIFLGPFLDKEDVSLLNDLRYATELKISSPEELLIIVNKLKAENTASMNSP